ncbi:MAG: alpha/beta hydrolase [Acidobacteria bacterium]|nr:alpha/beta hydrolase [Acidobacteriota bacterium]
MKELDWVTEIRLDVPVTPPNKVQRVMMFSGFASSPEVLRDLGTAIHERLPASVLMHGLAGHTGDEQSFYRSRAWHYWREAEELFLRYWKEEEKPLALVGYSTGANVVLTIAARHPSKVAGIILLSPYLRAKSTATVALSYAVAGLYYLALPLGAIAGLAYILRKRKRKSWPKRRAFELAGGSLLGFAAAARLLSSATVDLGEAPTLMRDGEEVRAPHYERVSIVGGSTLVPFQLLTRWIARKTVVPVTYVFGGKDNVVDVEHGVMIARQNPMADLFMLSNAQHRIVTEPGICDIVCTAILRCFDEEAARQQEFADVDITPDEKSQESADSR